MRCPALRFIARSFCCLLAVGNTRPTRNSTERARQVGNIPETNLAAAEECHERVLLDYRQLRLPSIDFCQLAC